MKSKLAKKLLSISNLDPCINLRNKSNNLIDLFNLVNQKDLNKFLWSNSDRLEIKNTDFNNIREKLDSFNNADDFIEYCLDNNFNLSKTTINQLSKNFNTNKSKAINEIFKKSITIAKIFKKFQNQADLIQKQENIYPLYVASGFINGTDLENKLVNAPIILFEVNIEIKSGTVFLIKNNDDITVNEKLNFYLEYNYGIKIDDNKLLKTSDLKNYQKSLKKLVNIDFNINITKFINAINQPFNYYNSTVLCLIEPLGGIIKKDLDYILNKKEDPFEVNNKIIDKQIIENEINQEPYNILEINRPLNIYQKYAINSSLVRNTLIYGPPGTGKSETIASLIANIIYQDKNVLMVSEKMAALDVLEKRLNNLSSISLFAFKPEHKNKFYDALNNFNKSLNANINDQQAAIKNNIKLIKNNYDLLKTYFKKISKITNDLINEDNIDKYIDVINTCSQINLNNEIHKWFNQLFIFWKNHHTLINSYFYIMKIYDLLISRNDAVEVLSSYHFKATKQEIINFLNYFNNHQHESWLLKNFIKSKKDYTKKGFSLSNNIKNELAILKLLETISISDIDEIDFSNIDFILNKPNIIDNELIYNQLIIYYLVLNSFENNKVDINLTLNDLIKNYLDIRKNIAQQNDILITQQYLYKIKNKINKNENLAKEVNTIISYAFLKQKPNINLVIKKHYETLRFLFPIWILSPNQTCILTSCKKAIFDYGIFDEASQMFLERAYPLAYRCKINIVAGDDKQLQPTSFFLKNLDEDLDQEQEILNQADSLFEQANISMWSKFYLKNHYRSNASELIAFSNKYIYNNELEFNTKNFDITNPIEVYNVKGVWKYQSNPVEVDKIIEILNNKKYENKSILIITFNQKQANLLENEISDLALNNLVYIKYQNQTLKIRSLENVQGDEADIVVLSISYAKDNNQQLRNFFGPLSQNGGINRLNVAITRAKEQMIIVKSIYANDIKTSNNINNETFKLFLQYVDNIKDSNINQQSVNNSKVEFINDIVNKLLNKIDNHKFTIKTNLIIGTQQIDIAIINNERNIISLSLILYCLKSFNDFNVFVKSINDIYFLNDLGYKTLVFSIFDWKLKTNEILNKIINYLTMVK